MATNYKIGAAVKDLKFDVPHTLQVITFGLPPPPLKKGNKGDKVKMLAEAMVKSGCLRSEFISTDFDANIAKALGAFQHDWGIKTTEGYDAHTRLAMAHALNGEHPKATGVHRIPPVEPPKGSPGDAIVTTAQKYLGVHEEPHGSNTGADIDKWLRRAHNSPGQPWCMAFASCMAQDAGHRLPFGETAGCQAGIDGAKQHHLWVPNDGHTLPKRGWIAIEAPAVHAMIVEGVRGSDQVDIAGNAYWPGHSTSNSDGEIVAEHLHSLSSMAGWIKTY